MAERRMFAKSVIGSARFLRMPSSSRLLYYDLGMQADDDGVVEAFSVMRTTGATEDDLRVLCSRGFVTVLNDDLVAYITDWTRNNQIKKDRYHPSIYADLLVQIECGTNMEPNWNPNGTQMEPQVRLGKDRIGKDTPPKSPQGEDTFAAFWSAYPRKDSKAKAQASWDKLKPDKELVSRIMTALEQHKRSDQWNRDGGQYIPYPATWLNQRRWEDEGITPTQPEPPKKRVCEEIRDENGEVVNVIWRDG